MLMLAAAPLFAAIEGVVLNGSTGREQPDVNVTLVKLDQGMVPVGTARSDAYGKFRFAQSAVGPTGQPAPVLLRAEFEGVTYNQMIPPGSRTADVKVTVYRAAKADGKAGAPEQRIVLFQPSGREMVVDEFYLFQNASQPPVTYADAKQGTLRLYLPAEAKGVVQASATGPGGMPVRIAAEKSDQTGMYKVNFPIKPGESRINLSYLVPYESPMQFEVQSLYQGLVTRVAAPTGVTLSGDGLQALPENPQLKASVFGAPQGKSFQLSISGQGRLSADRAQANEGGGENISVVPAAIHNQLALVLGFTLTILALGFFALYIASPAAEKQNRARSKRKA